VNATAKEKIVSEIQSLTSEITGLSASVDWWNSAIIIMMIVAAAAATGLFLTQGIAFRRARELANTEAKLNTAKDSQLALDMKDKDQKIAVATQGAAQAQERAGKAEENLAAANERAANALQHAAEAQKTAESFRRDIAQANERSAEANRVAEQERLARIKIEEKLSGWRLEPESQMRLTKALTPFSGVAFDLAVNPTEYRFMETLDEILLNAGWQRQQPQANITILMNHKASINYSSGITVEFALDRVKDFGPPADALIKGLIAEGIPATGNAFRQGGDPSAIHVVIGSR